MAKQPKTPAPAKVPEIVDKDPLGVGQGEQVATGDGTGETLPPAEKSEGEVVAEAITDAIENGVLAGAETIAAAIAETIVVPPAPGDEPDAVMDRRLARLTQLVEDAEFESGTAFGDLRDCMLDLYKTRPPIAWSAMTQSSKQDVLRAVEAAVKMALQKIVIVIAEEDSLTIAGTLLGDYQVKGESVQAKVKIDHVDDETILQIFKMAGHKVILVSADDRRFMSAKRDVPVPPDQLGLGFADDKPKGGAPTEIRTEPPAHPADDRDLAGEAGATRTHGADSAVDDEEEETPEEEPTATGTHRVYDAGEKVYLMINGEWDESIETAGSWPLDVATSLAEQEEATLVEVGKEPEAGS